MLADIHPGSAVIGLAAIAILVVWGKVKWLKSSPLPPQLIVVGFGVGMGLWFQRLGGTWLIEPTHMVQVPVADSLAGFASFLQSPDFSQWNNSAVYFAALTIAAVASLETLLNLEAIDKIDPLQRISPPSRELFAQGVGNVASGLLGGIPIMSVIIRSSVNINAGGRTKLAAIVHGILILLSVLLFPAWLNLIPLSCLAAILLVTGYKLASPALIKQMWVGRRALSVHSVRGDGDGYRVDRSADRHPCRPGGEL